MNLVKSSTNVMYYKQSGFPNFLGPHERHMQVPRPGIKSELQLPAYTTATATPDPSRVCDPHRQLMATPDP